MGHRDHSALHKSIWRMGKVLRDSGPKIFTVETTINTDAFPSTVRLPPQARVGVVGPRPCHLPRHPKSLNRMPNRAKRKIFHSIEAPYGTTSVQAGFTPSVHELTLKNVYDQHLVEVQGQTDILTMGIPFICPYNPEGIMNPILVMCMGLGYLFNMYRNMPLVREGGVVIMTHPTYREFNPVHHPSYIDFFDEVLTDTTDPAVMSTKWEKKYAEDEWYRHLYRTGNAYHGVHPFYAWYWGAHGQQHAGRSSSSAATRPSVRRLGFTPASTMDDAFEIATDVVGRSPTITHLHVPGVLVADVHRWVTIR
jgi:lactate racemase